MEASGISSDKAGVRFDLIGGRLCLDFANEVLDDKRSRIKDFRGLVTWSFQAAVLTESEAAGILGHAELHPIQARKVLRRARSLRNAIYRTFSAGIRRHTIDAGDLDVLNSELARALARSRIVAAPQGFAWDWASQDSDLDSLLWPVAVSASQVLTDELPLVRECAAVDCSRLFIDVSKNRSRHWCDMRLCGNRAKARRHYQKVKGT